MCIRVRMLSAMMLVLISRNESWKKLVSLFSSETRVVWTQYAEIFFFFFFFYEKWGK